MLEETDLFSTRVLSPFGEGSGDNELSVLPRHTKVTVTGNNRTKSVLVGLRGVVKKAVGLGGWHWLVLKNGVEVKLQRNALSVLEHPTGNDEQDIDHDLDSSSDSAILEKECNRSTETKLQKLSKPKVQHSKAMATSAATPIVSSNYQYVQSIIPAPKPVYLAKLSTRTLWRYCRYYHLIGTQPSPLRNEVLRIAEHHFTMQRLNEKEVIMDFVRLAKRRKAVRRRR